MPPISAPMNPKNAPPTCRRGAGHPVSAPPFPATPWAGVASAKPPLPLSEPLFSPSCAPTVKSKFLAIIQSVIIT
jgi:hypothetical protein